MLEIDRNSNVGDDGAEEKYIIGKTDWVLWNEVAKEQFKDCKHKMQSEKIGIH